MREERGRSRKRRWEGEKDGLGEGAEKKEEKNGERKPIADM